MIIAQEVNPRIVNTQGSVPASLLAHSLNPLKAAAAGGVTAPPAAAPGGVDNVSPVSLGINANLVRGGVAADDKGGWSRLYSLQSAAAKLLKKHRDSELQASGVTPGAADSRLGYHRVCFCHWAKWADEVSVAYSGVYGRSTYKGLQTCASWSACPVCGLKLAEVKRGELLRAVAEVRERGNILCLGSLTLRHAAGDDLAELLDDLNTWYRRIKRTKTWARLERQYGVVVVGRRRLVMVKGFENNWSELNGHHPHHHPLFVLAPGSDVAEFERELRDLWYSTRGGRWVADSDTGELLPADRDAWEHGARVTCNDGKVADYISKWGRPPRWDLPEELSKWHRKVGRDVWKSPHYSMMELLASFVATGNARHGSAWVQFAVSAKGRHQLDWSPGWREWLGLGDEKSDKEIIDDDRDYKVQLVALDDATWRVVCDAGKRGELRSVADSGSAEMVRVWLDDLWASWSVLRPPGGVVVALGPSSRGSQCLKL